jgi:hypothetical protein
MISQPSSMRACEKGTTPRLSLTEISARGMEPVASRQSPVSNEKS